MTARQAITGITLALTFAGSAALAETGVIPTPGHRPLESLLDQDARFDISVARASGYEGVLDASGLTLGFEETTGAPVFRQPGVPLDDLRSPMTMLVSGWSEVGGGANGAVYAVAMFDGNLVIGGGFSQVGGSTPVSNIASWNGTTWSSLNFGLNGTVRAFYVHPTLGLIVGGSFQTPVSSPPDELKRVALWNGATWEKLADGFNDTVYALTGFDDWIIAGGEFTWTGNGQTQLRRISYWDGTGWQMMGWGFDNDVRALAAEDGSTVVYAGGIFSKAYEQSGGTHDTYRIAGWTGPTPAIDGEWAQLDPGLIGSVYSLTIALRDGLIVPVAGGSFTKDRWGVELNRVASWHGGTDWRSFGEGVDSSVYTLGVYHGQIVAGGTFERAEGVGLKYLARWDLVNSRWRSVGNGPTDVVRAVHHDDNVLTQPLYAGGSFTSAGGVPCKRIAAFSEEVSAGVPFCAADIDVNGDVGFTDLVAVLGVWGPCAGCPEDLDGNDDVGFSDLVIVLSAWGPCPTGLPTATDCNSNGFPDSWEIAEGFATDCNGNGVPDQCDVDPSDPDGDGWISDDSIGAPGVPDECEGDIPEELDVNGNGFIDWTEPDCNGNGIPDEWDISTASSLDLDGDTIPDDCEPDCDGNGSPDAWEIEQNPNLDLDGDGVLDVPGCDNCLTVANQDQLDCNDNGIGDACEIADGSADDCNCNGIPDDCDVAIAGFDTGYSEDLFGPGGEGGPDGIPDECNLTTLAQDVDCDQNGVLDACDIADDPSLDLDEDGILDACGGACCLGDGTCVLVRESECAMLMGSYVGGNDCTECPQ